ncbi:glycosyltransferase [Laribacter hongkongensis]|uniref:glycosyltransferase n=1 Tax=Laribacter hongkongensis TaxID=168471 RepID=UPI001EFEEFDD|nr:glycosyltransferase [Laribacter hongkongensis]MCG9032889.1 glycosyltransferase [Laribacter hongkongensis]MCG9092483.1 glycosyltransferase [Laribacter hongkongensis]
MKFSVLCAGMAEPHAGWAAIDELAELLVHYFDAELLSPKPWPSGWGSRWLERIRPRYQPVDTAGGDVLMVVCRGPADLALISAVPGCRRRFQRIHAWVTDSYFQAGFGRDAVLYDGISVTAVEDAAFPHDRFGIPVVQIYQGADCLKWAPRHMHVRDIDLIGYGRTPPGYQTCFARRFHSAASPYLYLHSPVGHVTGSSVHLERGMLFKLLQRTRISLAFHLYVEPQGQRPRSMMVTSRWLESLLAGCIVAGRRPVSRMADEMLFWPGATLELAEEPEQAADQVQSWLQHDDDWQAQRRCNIHHMLLHHDWRWRLMQMCQQFGWPAPQALHDDIAGIRELAKQFA